MRTLVHLNDAQAEALDRIARDHSRSRAAVIGEAVDAYIARHLTVTLEDGFGLWGSDGEDGLAYQERMRAAW
jgi:predicted transcriptional regulator